MSSLSSCTPDAFIMSGHSFSQAFQADRLLSPTESQTTPSKSSAHSVCARVAIELRRSAARGLARLSPAPRASCRLARLYPFGAAQGVTGQCSQTLVYRCCRNRCKSTSILELCLFITQATSRCSCIPSLAASALGVLRIWPRPEQGVLIEAQTEQHRARVRRVCLPSLDVAASARPFRMAHARVPGCTPFRQAVCSGTRATTQACRKSRYASQKFE